jgi:hypothetical protein
MSTEECKKMLRRHVNTKKHLVTIFVDVNHSSEVCPGATATCGKSVVDEADVMDFKWERKGNLVAPDL